MSRRARGRRALVVLALGVIPPPAVHAQDLPLRVDYPGSAPFACPSWDPGAPPAPEEEQAALQLASEANGALVLGDMERARALLDRALKHSGGSAELLYRRGRLAESLGERDEAVTYLCRASTAGSEESVADARARLDSLVMSDPSVPPPPASDAFERGLDLARARRWSAAAEAFSLADDLAGGWPLATYNRGVVLGRLGDYGRAVSALRRYLAAAPGAADAVEVARIIGRWSAPSMRQEPDAKATLALGLVMPGMGQFYTRRPRTGAVVLGAAGGALAAGLLVRRRTVVCLDEVPPGSTCAPGRAIGDRVERPYLVPSLLAAAGVTVLGAIEALLQRPGGAALPAFLEDLSGGPAAREQGEADIVFLSVTVR